MLNLFRGKFNQICIVARAGVTGANIVLILGLQKKIGVFL
nr:MAG TPA: hypothetical protein [Caudoviricetes sp.]